MSGDYPGSLVPVGHVAPVPRRIRAYLAGALVLDTQHARYLWENPNYPAFHIPRDDVADGMLVPEGTSSQGPAGTSEAHGLRLGELHRPGAAAVVTVPARPELAGTVRFTWDALDAWFEEDEQVFVHPRSPYARVDALRSGRSVRVERDGLVLAESSAPVLVFETGLPTRYYLSRVDVDWTRLEASPTVTACPYKGVTSGYWSARVSGRVVRDLAWAYDFPTVALAPIAGLVAFYNERVDLVVDGVALPRPKTRL